jgi:predicted small lipoprotein YifL
MALRPRIRLAATLAALAAIATLAGCGSRTPEIPDDLAWEQTAAEESAPLGGAALAQRRQDMQRAANDLIHFHATLESLHHRGDRNGLVLFSGFLDAYMGLHLDPLLRGEWQSKHPELMALDATLRLVKAEVLIQMRAPRRVQQVIDEILTRFEGRENMLVDYPIGSQGTLQEGLRILTERKWRG